MLHALLKKWIISTFFKDLWLQQRVAAKELKFTNVLGTSNPADMLIKNLARADLDKHIQLSGLIIYTGRAEGSLHVNALERLGALAGVDGSYGGTRSRVEIAHASAQRSYMLVGTSKVGLPPSPVRGYHFRN